MRRNIELPIFNGPSLPAVEWERHAFSATLRDRPQLLLLSDSDSVHEWDEFAQIASERWRAIALCDISNYQLMQAVWAIGEPVAVCANGSPSGTVALEAQSIASGAIPLVALIDFQPIRGLQRPPGRVAIVRGRQSERLSHEEAVKARQMVGNGCELVEIENCGDNAAASCPSEFDAALSWLWFGD